jgi:hypothetical protein
MSIKKINFYTITVLLFIVMSLNCYAKNSTLIEFAERWSKSNSTNINYLKKNKKIVDGKNSYILEPDGLIYKIENEIISSIPFNTKRINITSDREKESFQRFVSVIDHYLLYSMMREEEINCDAFKHHYRLYALDLTTGVERELAQKMQPYNTVGGCYNPRDVFPEPIKETWTALPDKNYPSSAYTLRKDIAYFELRKYLFKRGKQVSNRYIPYLSIYRKKLSSFPPKIVKAFQKIPFEEKKWTGLTTKGLGSPDYAFKVKGFIIKTDNKFWVINEKKDIAWLFDKIDTEAEVYQYMKMYQPYGRKVENSYKKTATGYDVKQVQIEYKSEIEVTRNGYDEYVSYQLHSTYIYHINANGEFTKEFVSTESKNKKRSKLPAGFHGDPMFRDDRSPHEIFSQFKGVVTPPN